ncbi:energy transducer TonB [Granulicella cerasi]|uniref:Energy transducer TonB n=1 Tax=Granulicella cerasi TaxID=741063 RepID=A0ABW1Z6C8_9BACT
MKLNNFAAPHKIDPPAASHIALGASAASMPNHDAHPSAVKLGNSAVNPTGPAVATKVNMGGGMPNMNASNTGNGPRASSVNLGSGSPNGSVGGHDRAAAPVAGLSNSFGRPGGHGAGGPAAVSVGGLGQVQHAAAPPPAPKSAATPPALTYRPEPAYTEEARAAHIEGNVQVRIRVLTNGTVQFISIVHGLGYGLDAQARKVVEGMRFKPSMDASGQPVEWTGEVIIRFHLS